MSYRIDGERASNWVNEWKDSFETLNDDPTSMRTLIFLTLLERQEQMSSYQDIAGELHSRGLIDSRIDDFVPLRNGMNQLMKGLNKHPVYEIETRRNGKESRYRLKERDVSAQASLAAISDGSIVKVLDDQELVPSTESVAAKLMTDRRLPFYSIYLPFHAASRWALYSEGEAGERSKYEGEECERLLENWLSNYRDRELSIIGLGIGEGIGEIEIIRRLLAREPGFSRIHYCAVDTNIHLLTSHIQRLEDNFKNEIKTRRLVCGVVCGNFLESFSKLIQRLRAEFKENGQFDDPLNGFLPNTGTIISVLGNVVGNLEQRASEWSYFQPVLEELKGYDLAFLLGVSVLKGDEVTEKYSRELEELLLATPRYLTHETNILTSHQPDKSTDTPEFILPKDKAAKKKRCPDVTQHEYEGDGLRVAGTFVEGKIYEFYYTTQWELSMKLDEQELTIPKESNLLLYNIIKFDKDKLVGFLKSKGLFPSDEKLRPDAINSGHEDRRYVVMAVTNTDPRKEQIQANGHQA